MTYDHSKYSAAMADPKGPGDGRPTALQVVEDEGLVGKLGDMTMVVTGTSSGIGIETARALAATGARVFCLVRDLAKGQQALHDVLAPGRVELVQMDNGSLASVRTAAQSILSKAPNINVLVANAGIMAVPERTLTVDGHEAQFATNHLAHFLLFELLKDALLAGSTPRFNSRVVTVASTGHRAAAVQFDNLDFAHGGYSPWVAYGQSKTANIYMANEIDRLFGSRGLHGLSIHPGGIWSGLQTHIPDDALTAYKADTELAKLMRTPAQGAALTVFAAVGKEWEGRGGKYLEDMRESQPAQGDLSIQDSGRAPHAYDQANEERLWRESLRILSLPNDM